MLLTKVLFIWLLRFRGEDLFLNRPTRNKDWLWRPCLLTDRDEIHNPDKGPSIHAAYHVSVHLAKRFQRNFFFFNRPLRNKHCLWRPCMLMDRDEMIDFDRDIFIDAFYQVSIHLTKRFQRRRFSRNQTIRNKNCLWRPCLLTDRDKI